MPDLGTYILYDRVVGPLSPGKYKIKIEQNIDINTNNGGESHSAESERVFTISGPRWSINSPDIHSVYPPRNDEDSPTESYVPFITLGRKTLPWERSIFSSQTQTSNDINSYPWVALLVFTDEELTDSNGVLGIHKGEDKLKLLSDKVIGGITYSGVFANKPSTMAELGIDNGGHDDLEVDALRVDSETLKSIAPTVDELRLLSHVRRVNPSDKENCGNDDDGWFSVVMSNRVLSKSKKYHACLVSLEGRFDEQILPDNVPLNYTNTGGTSTVPSGLSALLSTLLAVPNMPFFGTKKNENNNSGSPTSQIEPVKDETSQTGAETKLVLLHHWSFSTSDIDGDFQSRMEGLRVRVNSDQLEGVERGDLISLADVNQEKYGQYTKDNIEPLLLGTNSVPGMTSNSYLRTEMVGADGISDEVLYRGPFTAVPENHHPKQDPYQVSDEALGIVEELGIWDISHASAFELGRLMALQDTILTGAVHQWITESKSNALDIERERRMKENNLDSESLADIISKIDFSKVARPISPDSTKANIVSGEK